MFSLKVPYLFISIFLCCASTSASISSDEKSALPGPNAIPQYDPTNEVAVGLKLDSVVPVVSNVTKANDCFHADEFCLGKETPDCFMHSPKGESIVCCHITDMERTLSSIAQLSNNSVKNVHIINASLVELDLSKPHFKQLNSLAVTDGKIKRIIGIFSKMSLPICLNFSNNNILDINQRAMIHLNPLQTLDISYNNLTTLPFVPINITVDIRGNLKMLCKSINESLERGRLIILEPDTTFCLANKTFNWFNSTEKLSIRHIENMRRIQFDCPVISGKPCTCVPERMHYENDQQNLVFNSKVDCSNMGINKLPEKLPENTISLNVSNNKITSLSALGDNPSYNNIVTLFADYNQISSILELEGTKFLENFSQLGLRNNRIRQIPIYLLTNTLERNPNGRILFLGGNRLHCDCNSAKVLRMWLLAKQSHVQDYDKILCDNLPYRIFELSEAKLCSQPAHDWTYYIYYIIALELLLLIALIMKVSYDYYIFKTQAKLPFKKIPKLPFNLENILFGGK